MLDQLDQLEALGGTVGLLVQRFRRLRNAVVDRVAAELRILRSDEPTPLRAELAATLDELHALTRFVRRTGRLHGARGSAGVVGGAGAPRGARQDLIKPKGPRQRR